jgi:cholesterol transport system auxiliary component
MTQETSGTVQRRQFIAAAGAVLLSGCGGIQLLPTPPSPQLYVLRPQPMLPMGAPVPWRLSVGEPDAPAGFDTTRIALSRSATTMDYFANAAWNDRVPLLLQRLLIQTFDNSGRIVAVDRDTAGLENDYLLQTEIHDFEARYDTPDAAPQIIVSIQAKLARMPQREIVAALNATQQAQASANTLDSVVLAFDQAAGAVIAQIAAWTLNAPPPPPNPQR